MSRHPLVFLSILVALGILIGAMIAMQLAAARRQDKQEDTLRAIRNDLDELVNGTVEIGEPRNE
jgi:hypothetical protein